MKIMNPEFRSKVQVAEALPKLKNLPMLTGRQIAFMTYAYCKVNDVQERAMSMNDLLNIELVKGNLTKFDQAWEENSMALEKQPEADLSGCLYHRQFGK